MSAARSALVLLLAGAACTGTAGPNADAGPGGGAGGSSGGGAGGGSAGASGGGSGGTGGGAPDAGCDASYDARVLCDQPVAYWALAALDGTVPDLTGHGHTASWVAGPATAASLPNGEPAADFNGTTQYLTVASAPGFSIPTTGALTWEAWIRPDVLQFPQASADGYVDFMGKCDSYAPTCEWESRMYTTTNPQSRCNRLSAYVFNPSAGLGSAADWQPTCGLLSASQWLHVVGEYTLSSQPSGCANASTFPGAIDIWVNGVKWDQASHGDTGCMSQYSVQPVANQSALIIGSMAFDTWFAGAIGKVAVYPTLLTDAQIAAHYRAMTGHVPTGSCAASCSF